MALKLVNITLKILKYIKAFKLLAVFVFDTSDIAPC